MTPAADAFGTLATGQRSNLVAFTVTNPGAITTARPGRGLRGLLRRVLRRRARPARPVHLPGRVHAPGRRRAERDAAAPHRRRCQAPVWPPHGSPLSGPSTYPGTTI